VGCCSNQPLLSDDMFNRASLQVEDNRVSFKLVDHVGALHAGINDQVVEDLELGYLEGVVQKCGGTIGL
jgi:hypothetical protein